MPNKIQDIINVAKSTGTIAKLPPGETVVTETIDLSDVSGMVIRGTGTHWAAPCQVGTVLYWDGPAGQDMFRLENSRELVFRDFQVNVRTPLDSVFHSISDHTTSPTPPVSNLWDNVFVDGRGNLDVGYRFSWVNADQNNSEMTYRNCYVRQCKTCWLLKGFQAKTHNFFSCQGITAEHCIKADGAGFQWFGGIAQHCTVSAFENSGAFDPVGIYGAQLEGCARLYQDAGFGGQNPQQVTIENIRFSLNNLNPDGAVVVYGFSGPLKVSGLYALSPPTGVEPHIRMFVPGATGLASAIIEGNTIDTAHPTGLELHHHVHPCYDIRYQGNIRRRSASPVSTRLPTFGTLVHR